MGDWILLLKNTIESLPLPRSAADGEGVTAGNKVDWAANARSYTPIRVDMLHRPHISCRAWTNDDLRAEIPLAGASSSQDPTSWGRAKSFSLNRANRIG
jgi:hypothetical protein